MWCCVFDVPSAYDFQRNRCTKSLKMLGFWEIQFSIESMCSHFILVFAIISCHICFKQSLPQVIMLVEEWIDTYSIQHWRIFRSKYRKLAWVEFEPTTTEFLSDALTDWAIRPWVQLALRANYIYKFTSGCHSQTTPSLEWR